MDPQKATQRMMAAGALLVAGVGLLGISLVMNKVQGALTGEPRDPPAAVAEAAPAEAPKLKSGVIHVEPGDPLPPATPLPRPEADAPRPPVAARPDPAPAEGRDPGGMTRGELIDEVTQLRARVAELSRQPR